MNTERYFNSLKDISSLFALNTSKEAILHALNEYFRSNFPNETLRVGLYNSHVKVIDWLLIEDKSSLEISVSNEKVSLFHEKIFLGEGPLTKEEKDCIVVYTPMRLFTQIIGLVEFKSANKTEINELKNFLELIASYFAFFFIDLKIQDDKLIKKDDIYEKYESIDKLNQKLLSIIDVARSLAHELNQPLTGITGYCTLIMETLESSDGQSIQSDLEKILEQTARLEALIFKFQSIAHIEGRANNIVL